MPIDINAACNDLRANGITARIETARRCIHGRTCPPDTLCPAPRLERVIVVEPDVYETELELAVCGGEISPIWDIRLLAIDGQVKPRRGYETVCWPAKAVHPDYLVPVVAAVVARLEAQASK
ncbi:hypothetical protein [Spongiactinospora sp. TRM90649]|uniref:hypothetical protein n=1 Tax=Spongiactinospora sp. TRM90649 TaxID=3031114 RepID=UPI0023F7BC42|nr:hypothetical protein [Spongiactinospora sp. TRM90649]MDF5756553.1 hypothetical protein [Spongiactinospora sp. TRM90649]